jgi:hypothetical protein
MRKRSSQSKQSPVKSNSAETNTSNMVRLSPTRRLGYVLGLIVFGACSYMYLIPLLNSQKLRLKPNQASLSADLPKRDAVVDAFKHAWHAYERDAMGADEYHPISKQGSNLSSSGGIGYTVTDAIDTMFIMGLDNEYSRARKWIATKLTFDRQGDFNTFEV